MVRLELELKQSSAREEKLLHDISQLNTEQDGKHKVALQDLRKTLTETEETLKRKVCRRVI